MVVDARATGDPAAAPSAAVPQPIAKRQWPIMLGLLSLTQLAMLFVEYGMNARWTGSAIQKDPFNSMIGPDSEVSIVRYSLKTLFYKLLDFGPPGCTLCALHEVTHVLDRAHRHCIPQRQVHAERILRHTARCSSSSMVKPFRNIYQII